MSEWTPVYPSAHAPIINRALFPRQSAHSTRSTPDPHGINRRHPLRFKPETSFTDMKYGQRALFVDGDEQLEGEQVETADQAFCSMEGSLTSVRLNGQDNRVLPHTHTAIVLHIKIL
ncbi:hypothetical protein [Pseudomonas fluorescens]|nr:hypothetical protein [Pseudomonas fluorescens]